MSSIEYRYLVAIGANLEPRASFISDAIKLVRSRCGEVAVVSSFLETDPIGVADKPFLNGVFDLRSSLKPDALLVALQDIEHQLGRKRTIRWGNRTIDLDIILWQGNGVCKEFNNERLRIPHPSFRDRSFVMIPLAEIGSDWLLPEGVTVRELGQLRGYLS